MVFAVNTRDKAKVVVMHNILANTLNYVQPPVPVVDHDMSQRVEFMQVGKQNAWDAMSISCPADSPARDFGHPASPSPVNLSDFESAVLEQTLYKEWQDDWLISWAHYVPVNMDLGDIPEIIR